VVHYSTSLRLAEVAEEQWGLVTRQQAEMAGVSRATLQRLASGGVLERAAHGVYQLAGAPTPDQQALIAAWLQLAPATRAWQRVPAQGVVSHRSAAAAYGLGHLPADRHEFTLPARRQSRRPDVRLHRRPLRQDEWEWLRGLPVTRPSRIAADLLDDNEDPEAVATVVADALRAGCDEPGVVARALGRHTARVGLVGGGGPDVLRWLLDLVGDQNTPDWIAAAQSHLARTSNDPAAEAAHAADGRG
jgi:predicted transcriptional regulator of viral defense system